GSNMMKLPRRNFLHLAAGAAALPAVSRLAKAQNYPTRPVRIVVGLPAARAAWARLAEAKNYPTRPGRIVVGLTAGSASDIVARLVGQWLSERLGQPFVGENRPRAGPTIVAR